MTTKSASSKAKTRKPTPVRKAVPTNISHLAYIRAQITREVEALKKELAIPATEVSLGFWINCHKGEFVFNEGDEIAGLRIKIDRVKVSTITVRGVKSAGSGNWASDRMEERSISW